MSLSKIAGAPVEPTGNSRPEPASRKALPVESSSPSIGRPSGLLATLKDGSVAPNRGGQGGQRMRAGVPSFSPSNTAEPPRRSARGDSSTGLGSGSAGYIEPRLPGSAQSRSTLRLRAKAQPTDHDSRHSGGRFELRQPELDSRSEAPLASRPSLTTRRRDANDASSGETDTRSNKAIIDAYRSGKRSELDVQKVTASLLKLGGSFPTTMRLFTSVKEARIRPSLIMYNAVISACDKAGHAEEALALIAELNELGKGDPSMRMDLFTFNAAISAYGNAGKPDEALALLDELKQRAKTHPTLRPSVVSYGAAISACAKAGRADEALALLRELRVIGERDPAMRPNDIVYNAAISACANAGMADQALRLLREITSGAARGEPVRANAITYNSALCACANAGRADDALLLLDELEHFGRKDPSIRADLITYNTAISACGNGGRPREALALLSKLRRLGERDASMRPTVTSYNAAIFACEKAGLADEALALLAEMKGLPIRPSIVSYSAVMSACEKSRRTDEALALFDEIKELAQHDSSMRPTVVTYSAAIAASGKAGLVDRALAFLTELNAIAAHDASLRPDIGVYNAAIMACAKAGRPEQAHELLKEARHFSANGMPTLPNATSYGAVISAYSSAGHAQRARELIGEAIAAGVFVPHAGYDKGADSLDFHEDHVCTNPSKSERPRGIASTLAVALLRYHLAAGNVNRRTTYIVGQHGDNAVKQAVLAELNRHWPEGYAVSIGNPGVLIPCATSTAEGDRF